MAPGSAFDPDDIAEHYWRLHTQPAAAWQREVVYSGRSAITVSTSDSGSSLAIT